MNVLNQLHYLACNKCFSTPALSTNSVCITSAWRGRCWSCSLPRSWSCEAPRPVCRSWCTVVNTAPPHSCRHQTRRTELLCCRRSCSPTAPPHTVCTTHTRSPTATHTSSERSHLQHTHLFLMPEASVKPWLQTAGPPAPSLAENEEGGGSIRKQRMLLKRCHVLLNGTHIQKHAPKQRE